MEAFEKINEISLIYSIPEEHAGCYLCNFEDNFICHMVNGECKKIKLCKMIKKNEEYKSLIEEAAEEIENLYGRETELSNKLRDAINQ